MKIKNVLNTVIILIFISGIQFAQVSNVNLESKIYPYLSKLAQKGIINYDDLVKPISRKYAAEKLIEARYNFAKLTSLQKDELEFFEAEFGYEIKQANNLSGVNNNGSNTNEKSITENEESKLKNGTLTLFAKDEYNRLRSLSYENNLMRLNVSPLIGIEKGKWEKTSYTNLFFGIKFNGDLGNVLGYNFELEHTRQTPGRIDNLYNRFSNKPAIDILFADNERIEYPTVNADLGVNWSWGSFVFGKNYLNWGYGENGKIVLSNRAPSFPYIKLNIKPAKWFRFDYIHAWLNSNVIDSNSYYATWRYRPNQNTDRLIFKSKFLALHSATFIPYENLELSLGESVVYADNIQVIYLIPFMFFDLGDEFLMRNNNYAGSSTQLFLSASSRNHIPNTHLYANFHADELTPDGLFDPKTQYYKMAFTFGANVVDLPINNLGATIEYTKVYPGEYRHFIPTLAYESSSVIMGHWIGDNADMIYFAMDYTFFRGFKIQLWTQYVRKGTEALGNRAYKITIPQPHFLFTDNIKDRKNYRYYGIDFEYEITHELWVKSHFQYIDYQQRIEPGKYTSTLYRDFSFAIGYGI